MAPVDDPEAKVKILVDSLLESLGDWLPPRKTFTRSKWCFDPTKSLTTLQDEEPAVAWETVDELNEKIPPTAQPLSS